MTENGVVVQCKDQFACVRIGRNSACAACGKCGMTEKQKHVDFFVENTLNAQVGDTVSVEIPEGNSASLALVAYILPIVPALVLMFVGFALAFPAWGALLMFLGGLALGFGVVVLIDKVRKHKWMLSPIMKSIIATANSYTQNPETEQPQTSDKKE